MGAVQYVFFFLFSWWCSISTLEGQKLCTSGTQMLWRSAHYYSFHCSIMCCKAYTEDKPLYYKATDSYWTVQMCSSVNTKQILRFNLSWLCVFFSASVCSQVLPAGGAAEALWDDLLQEHQHWDVCGDLQPHQGAEIDKDVILLDSSKTSYMELMMHI